ncbi:cyclic nucleotide-binding domain-containing protein [Chitinivibrio alkaliphilus]|uniref:Putative CAP family transcription factor n=1 Tax=Chitinivibrio alkaliphilus ACht1 TaxID=1313304 RepID=U7D750_9BACT|nr:cyclic nucleotide-binding domain-containing protein [Chitinivibrio alkaliphilus]ERP31773.1 putative CAP family transcription factor [Chitinivibrio alkaliphilus ACht1]
MASHLIPTTICISNNPEIKKEVSHCFLEKETLLFASNADDFDTISLNTASVIIIDFSDWHLGFSVLDTLSHDPWLHYQNVITIYNCHKTARQISGSRVVNLAAGLSKFEIREDLPVILKVIRLNRNLLSDRAVPQNYDFGCMGTYRIANSITEVEVLVNLVTSLLYNTGKIDWHRKSQVTTALMELLVNAVEHGNCEIGYNEKKSYLSAGKPIDQLIKQRLSKKHIQQRRVTFSYKITTEGSVFTIIDEGKGFNWKKYLHETKYIDYTGENGRGIMIALSSLDRLHYNPKGNIVNCLINHRDTIANEIPIIFRDKDPVKITAGTTIIREDEVSNTLFFIVSGRFAVSVNSVRISTITPDHVFIGEMALLTSGKRTATVRSLTDAQIIPIDKIDFILKLNQYPHYSFFMAKLLAQKLNKSNYIISKILDTQKDTHRGDTPLP